MSTAESDARGGIEEAFKHEGLAFGIQIPGSHYGERLAMMGEVLIGYSLAFVCARSRLPRSLGQVDWSESRFCHAYIEGVRSEIELALRSVASIVSQEDSPAGLLAFRTA